MTPLVPFVALVALVGTALVAIAFRDRGLRPA